MKVGPKVLFLDTENAPNIVASWGIHDQKINYSDILPGMEWFFICGQWSWNDSKRVNTVSILDDKKRYKKNHRDDYHVVKTLRDLISEADIVVGHNINGHDLKKLQAKIVEHSILPLRMPQVIDTYTWSRKFGFTSRSLKSLCLKLGLTQKLSHDPGVFIKAAMGVVESVKNIVTYGKGDIPTLRELYYRLRPYIESQPNYNHFRGRGVECCPKCGSTEFIASGYKYTLAGKRQRYQCKECGGWFCDSKTIAKVKMR